jgi:hypothetical protein
VGASLTITGSGFGASQGNSTVTFGELPNELGFAPISKVAKVLSWSDTAITVTVPSLSPGTANVPGTHHPVYVTVAGVPSNPIDFYLDPAATNPAMSGSTYDAATKTYSTAGSEGNHPPSQHDVLYDGCTFAATNQTLRGDYYGVVTLGQQEEHYSITFVNCTFKRNTGPGTGQSFDYGVNGVKSVSGWGSVVHDISFVNCTFEPFSRMAAELNEFQYREGESNAFQYNIAFVGCTFEPPWAECISFNFQHGTGSNHQGLIADCLFKGYSDWKDTAWGGCIENSGIGLELRNVVIWAGTGAALNFEGNGQGVRSQILGKNVTIDMSHLYQATPTPYSSRLFGWYDLSYSRWIGCTFNTGNATNHVYNAGWEGDWSSSTYNDFGGSTITGICGWKLPDGSTGTPSTAAGYWDPKASQTNIWPTRSTQ